MIDIHSHILPFVDDGSDDMAKSIEMIKEEIDFGVTDLFLTPHYMKIRGYLSSYEDNLKIFEDLKSELKKQNLQINLHLGNEIYATYKLIPHLKDRKTIPLGNTNFVLVEFSLDEDDFEIGEAINNLVASGYRPIIAHPERYEHITSMNDYRIMKKMGAFIQVNAGSLFGQYGKRAKKIALKLLKDDLADFIGSDVHDFRENHLRDAYDFVMDKFSKDLADRLFNNPLIFVK